MPANRGARPFAMAAVILLAVVLAGCGGEPVSAPPLGDAASDSPAPGIFVADEEGLLEGSIDGLAIAPGAAQNETRYAWDLLATLEPNRMTVGLVQALGPVRIQVSGDIEVVLDPIGEERRPTNTSCFHATVSRLGEPGAGDFFLGRALGDSHPAPEDGGPNTFTAPGFGGGGTGSLAFDTEPDFSLSAEDSSPLGTGDWMLMRHGFSQAPLQAVDRGTNRWWVNWTIEGPHRVIQVPDAPLYCHFGLGETEGGQHVQTPFYDEVAGSSLAADTLYGTSVHLEANNPSIYGGDPSANSAYVSALGRRCHATEEQPVRLTSFEPGLVEVEVEVWRNSVTFVLTGFGPRYGLVDDDAMACAAD